MSINPNKKGVTDGKGMIQRLSNARNPRKRRKNDEKVWDEKTKTMRNYWMSINPNKGPADRERMIQH